MTPDVFPRTGGPPELGPEPPAGKKPISEAAWLLGCLFATWLLVDAVLAAAVGSAPSERVRLAAVGAAFAQAAMVAAVLVWGRISLFLRVAGGGFWLAAVATVTSRTEQQSDPALWFGGLLLYSTLPWLCFALARLAGVDLRRLSPRGADAATPVRHQQARRLQFSMWQLLTAMTLAALLATAGKLAEFPLERLVAGWRTFVLLASASLLSGWAVLWPDCHSLASVLRAVVVLGLGAAAMVAASSRGLVVGPSLPDFWLANLVNAASVALTAGVLRVAGFRLAGFRRPGGQ